MKIRGARALVLLDHELNRNLLCDRLRRQEIDVCIDENRLDPSCDICFVDSLALARLHGQILQMKKSAEPVYIPCLLVSRNELSSRVFHQYHDCIDQVAPMPLSDTDLQIHLEIALRARRHSVSLNDGFSAAVAQAKLSEERYQIISELTSDYAYSFHRQPDGADVIEWTTHAFEQISGYTLEDVRRRGWMSLLHPDDLAGLRIRKQRLSAGLVDVREFRLITRTGETRWILDHAKPVMVDGKVSRVYGAAKDITEQKATQSALQASEQKNSEMARLIPVAIYRADAEGNIIYVNERWSQFTGLPLERAYGSGWKDALHPDDVGCFDNWEGMVREGTGFTAEFRYRRPDGTIIWAYTWGESQRAADGTLAGHIGTVADITQRKQAELALRGSENRLRRTLEALPIGVWITDVAGKVVHGNEAGRKIWTGALHTDVDNYTQHKGWRLDTGKKIETGESATARAIHTGETTIDEEIVIECLDGTRKIILNSAVPLRDDQHNIVGAIGVNQDISERKRAEEELRTHAEILTHMAEGVIVTDDEGYIFFINNATERMFGYAADELFGRHVSILKAAPLDEACRLTTSILVILRERGYWSGEFESRRKNGEAFMTTVRISRILIAGTPYTVSVREDVTELRKAEEIKLRLAAIVQSSDDAIVGTSLDGTVLSWNPGAEKMYGYCSGEVCGNSIAMLFPPGGDNHSVELDSHLAAGWGVKNFETRRRRKDGVIIDVSLTLSPVKDAAGNTIGAATIARDITEQKKAVENLRLWGRAIEAASNGIMIIDAGQPGEPIIYVNPGFERMSGYSSAEVLGKNARLLQGDDTDQPALQEIRSALHEQREGYAILRNYRKDGELFWNELTIAPVSTGTERIRHFIGIQTDVTERKRYEAELEYQATHDALTRLPNRNLLQDRLRQAIIRAHRDQGMTAVFFIDLDRFKLVNDSVGHEAGDQLLRCVSERLLYIFRTGDTVARQSGDEFVVVAERMETEQEAAELAQRLLQAMAAPLMVGGREFYTSCSIGIALYPRDGGETSELLKNADAAMYRAKKEGRNTFRFYAADMNARAHLRLELEAAMRRAVGRNEFVLHYQPQVELSTGRLIGFEALVRWQHPELGLMPPADFIGLAEETGLIMQIGEWVLREACLQAKRWQDQGLGEYNIAVNLSTRQFGNGDLIQMVSSALQDAGLAAKYLELEITESLLMENPDSAVDTLRILRGKGVSLSIDDFGTGYSSLGYLKRFSLDKLKIDRSFVRDITRDPDDAAIATAIIAMAHRLKLKVIAEGVETEGQLGYLRLHGCDEVQGYLFSRPLPADECTRMLRTRSAYDLPSIEEHENGTLLIVDNDVDAVDALCRLLREDGYKILTTPAADEGFEMLAMNKVRTVICGDRMHGMNGTEFLSRVRDLHPATVRIMLTEYAHPASGDDTDDTGAAARLMVKPLDAARLRGHIAEAFRGKKAGNPFG
ncbi:MAG: hypothetical protein JWQ21_4119 [Herminiimonas sp.]|nr:hypothetical protein [Herminiimonas sp.]